MAEASVSDAPVETQAPSLDGAKRTPKHAQVQGLVYSALGNLEHGRFDLLRITDAAACRTWLARLVPHIVTAEQAIDGNKGGTAQQADRGLYLAFAATGLRQLGLPDRVLETFSTPFTEGVVTEHRSRILGDHDANDPDRWTWGGSKRDQVDLLVITLWQTDGVRTELDELLMLGDAGGATGTEVVHSQDTVHLGARDKNDEHFGFADGISNVRFRGELNADSTGDRDYSVLSAGEIVLGCDDDSGHRPRSPLVPAADDPHGVLGRENEDRDLGQDGTYLVVRQLHQDVAAFRRWLGENADDSIDQDELAARVVGRHYDGTPLVPLDQPAPGERSHPNAFGFYDHDQTEHPCPIGAHIRRANPRDGRRGPGTPVDTTAKDKAKGGKSKSGNLDKTKRHRILRRGRAYGPPLPPGMLEDDGAERGLLFVALNADLERQFEFVQSHWLENETFARPGEVDPLVGNHENGARHFTVEPKACEPVRRRYGGLPQFVAVKGAGYFFLPRVEAVKYFSSLG